MKQSALFAALIMAFASSASALADTMMSDGTVVKGEAMAAPAGAPDNVAPVGEADTTLAYCKSDSSGKNFFQSCLTANGNILWLAAADYFGTVHEHLNAGNPVEGYMLCAGGVQYYDFAGYGDSGFGAPTEVAAIAAFPGWRKLARTTTDGKFTVRLYYYFRPANQDVVRLSVIYNNTGTSQTIRYWTVADSDTSSDTTNDFALSTRGHAVTSKGNWLTGMGLGSESQTELRQSFLLDYTNMFDLVTSGSCETGIQASPTIAGDYLLSNVHDAVIPAGGSVTIRTKVYAP